MSSSGASLDRLRGLVEYGVYFMYRFFALRLNTLLGTMLTVVYSSLGFYDSEATPIVLHTLCIDDLANDPPKPSAQKPSRCQLPVHDIALNGGREVGCSAGVLPLLSQ